MGFIEKLKNFMIGKSDEQTGIVVEDTVLSDSMVLEIEKMKQKVIAIEITNKEKGEELNKKIEIFENRIKGNGNDEFLKQDFKAFKKEFNEELKESEKGYLFNELDLLNERVEKFMWREELGDNQFDEFDEMQYLREKLKVLSNKKDIFEEERKQAYLVELIKANYKIQCLEFANAYRQLSFKPSSESERIVFATLIKEDTMKFYKYLSEAKYKYMIRDENYDDIERIEKELDRFVRKVEIQYSETMDLTTILDDKNMQESFIKIMRQVRNKVIYADRDIKMAKEKRKKEQEEQIRLKELEDKQEEQQELYKNLTEEEMKQKIEEIDDETFDITQSYINILEFEREIAEARGLLDKNNTLDVDDMEKMRISLDNIALAVLRANKLGINYVALLDLDDNEKNNLLIFPKGNRSTLLKKPGGEQIYNYYTNINGSYNYAFMEYVIEQGRKDIGYYNDKLFYVGDSGKKEFLKIYEDLEKVKLDENMVDGIKVGLKMPYLRPLVPILEKLKEAGIEYYIPPIDNETKRRTMDKQIYIDRKDLEKYKELVHPNISTPELGKIEIFSEDINLSEMILNGVKIDFIEEIKEEKKKQEKVKGLTDDEIRKEIKRIDDESFDVTESYKNILEYQKTVARAKGLLDEKSEMRTDDIAYKRTSKETVVALMKVADEKGIAYTVLLDVDDKKMKNCIIVASKKDIDKINGYWGYIDRAGAYSDIKGRYGKSFIYVFQNEEESKSTRFNKEGYAFSNEGYEYDREQCRKELKKFVKEIEKLDDKEEMKDVKCYLEFSYQRSMVPILEALKKEGIEYYIPPVDDDFNKVEPTMKIYIDRKDVKKYKENVHSKISNSNDGIVKLVGDNVTYLELVLEGTDSPYIERREERQK